MVKRKERAVNLVKWAGGKGLLVPELEKHFNLEKNIFYVEPFLGGGGSFLSLKNEFAAASDLNQSLIYLWEFVRDDLDDLMSGYEYYHEFHSPGGYEQARKQYNELIKDIGNVRISTEKKKDISILFLYIMKTCFNGLCRYSMRENKFNVPIGDKLPSVQTVRESLLIVRDRVRNTVFHCWDFEKMISHYKQKGSVFFYCDPPYSKVNGKGFQSYIGDWKDSDADRLAKVLKESGCRFAVSEIDCKAVRDRYSDCRLIELKAGRSIGGSRSKVDELLILSR